MARTRDTYMEGNKNKKGMGQRMENWMALIGSTDVDLSNVPTISTEVNGESLELIADSGCTRSAISSMTVRRLFGKGALTPPL